MKIKEVKPINFLFFRTFTTIHQLQDHVPVGQQLYKEAVSNNLWITGPVQWHYYNFEGDPNKQFEFEVALPVGDLPADYDGEFHIKRTDGFKCVSVVHEGSWMDIGEVYGKISKFIAEQKLVPINISREIYINVDFKDPQSNCTEIQFGVQ